MDKVTHSGERLGNWKPIPGYHGIYEVSDRGQVWSVKRPRKIHTGPNGAKFVLTYMGDHFMQPNPNKDNYQVVGLVSDGKSKTKLVHRLVLEAFVGPCPPGMEACHNNGDPSDNRLSNLRWDTHESNIVDRTRHSRRKTHCKYGHPFTAANTVTLKNGYRRCRRCELERNARRRRASAVG